MIIAQFGNLDHRRMLTWLTLLIGPVLAWSLALGGLKMVQYYPVHVEIDPIRMALKGLVDDKLLFRAELGLAFVLILADEAIEAWRGRYADELYSILKDIAENIKGGMSVEAALHKAVHWRTSSPAMVFQQALKLSDNAPLDQALRHESEASGQASMREVGYLVASAIGAGGDFGPALRWLAGHLQRLRQTEKEFTGKLSSSLMLLRFIALLAGPFMYMALSWAFANFLGVVPMIPSFAVFFFYFGVFCMALLDGLVYGRWDRVAPKLPFYLGLCRVSLFL